MTSTLNEVVERAYRVFARYPLHGRVAVCTCPVCMSEEDARLLAATPLREISCALMLGYTNSAHGLVEDEMRHFLPRYFELIADGEVPCSNGIEVCFARLLDADYQARWPRHEVEVVDAFFAAIFLRTLSGPAECRMGRRVLLDGAGAEEILCMVARAGGDVAPLLRLWDETTGRLADLRIAALINDSDPGPRILGSAFWDVGCHPQLEQPICAVFDWLARIETFERLYAARAHEEQPLARTFFESALDGWIKLVKGAGPRPGH